MAANCSSCRGGGSLERGRRFGADQLSQGGRPCFEHGLRRAEAASKRRAEVAANARCAQQAQPSVEVFGAVTSSPANAVEPVRRAAGALRERPAARGWVRSGRRRAPAAGLAAAARTTRSKVRKTNIRPWRSSGSLIASGRALVRSSACSPSRSTASTWPRSRPSRVPRLIATTWFWPAMRASP